VLITSDISLIYWQTAGERKQR